MGRTPDYETMYKVAVLLLKLNNADIESCNVSEHARRTGCKKSTFYGHMQKIRQDIHVI